MRKNLRKNLSHGLSRSRLYKIWSDMKYRCSNQNATYFSHYGARGISVCQEWAASFLVFRDWALQSGYSDTLQLDRADNDKNYCPENCRWVDRYLQMHNTRKRKDGKSSRFRGVCGGKSGYSVTLQAYGKRYQAGPFKDEIQAAQEYDMLVRRYCPVGSKTNF